MKTFFKTKAGLVLVLACLAFSCKKNETIPAENYDNMADSTEVANDTISADTTGTTGATGKGSTGSGSDLTNERGNTDLTNDSTSSSTGN